MNPVAKRHWGAIATLVGVTAFIVTVALLQILQREYDPQNQLMSELALGQHGWAMLVAFLGLAIAFYGMQAAICGYGAATSYRILLGAAALLFLAAGIFPLGNTSEIHIGFITLAFIFAVLAMYLFPTAAGSASIAAPRIISWTLATGFALSVVLGQYIPIGVGQRLAAGCLLVWLAVSAWRMPRS